MQSVLRAALEASGVCASEMDMLSMHGTGRAIPSFFAKMAVPKIIRRCICMIEENDKMHS